MNERARFWALAVLFGLVVNAVVFFGLPLVVPVQAAPTVPDVCEQVAKVGDIVYYYCEPDTGPAFLTNSVGFMVLDQ